MPWRSLPFAVEHRRHAAYTEHFGTPAHPHNVVLICGQCGREWVVHDR